ncbi:MAG: hypothetical protein V1893_03120 [Candidatus Omnitrophota bacterium]
MANIRAIGITVLISSVLLFIVKAEAFEGDDTFGPSYKIEGKNLTIYYSPGLEMPSLVQALNIRPADRLLAGKSLKSGYSQEEELADILDTLFIEVCEILDMRLYSFKGDIKICKDQNQLNKIYYNLFDKELRGTYSFYVRDNNTIYISAENFKREILGHEIAHAIICHYFVVSPSVKIQEVLSKYVEYQLRKSSQQIQVIK